MRQSVQGRRYLQERTHRPKIKRDYKNERNTFIYIFLIVKETKRRRDITRQMEKIGTKLRTRSENERKY